MPRPTTKADLIDAANVQFEKLWNLIDSMSEGEQTASFNFGDDYDRKEAHWARDKNLRDVLIHLYEWHQLLINWVESNQKGDPAPFLPAPYNWKSYGDLNISFWNKHQETSYNDSKKMLEKSHGRVINIIDSFTNDELFTKKHFSWTGTTTLGSYCISATSSHYEWATKKIKQHLKTYKPQTEN